MTFLNAKINFLCYNFKILFYKGVFKWQVLRMAIGTAEKEFGAFKKFISRGNVADMAVGVIIGVCIFALIRLFEKQIISYGFEEFLQEVLINEKI